MHPSEASLGDIEPGTIEDGDAIQWMYHIIADIDRDFDEKINSLLQLGCTYLDAEVGFATKIEEGTQHIEYSQGEHELLQVGESCPLNEAYCKRTIEHDGALTAQHAGIEGWEGDSAYEVFGLETYIGVKITVEDELHGTFCFADSNPRETPFTDAEETVVELMGKWVSYELFQQQAIERIAEQRDRLDEYTRIISHDLRNPVSIIKGYLDIAEETGDPEDFDKCRKAVERMDSMIEKLLVLSRSGEIISEHTEVDLNELSRNAWFIVEKEDATLDVQTEQVVQGDEHRLQQMFENLFRNAVEHGGSSVEVEVGDLPDNDGIYVADNGPGIPEDEREDMFDNGMRLDEDGERLGLSIVSQIALAHDWTIEAVESDAGGAQFNIWWN